MNIQIMGTLVQTFMPTIAYCCNTATNLHFAFDAWCCKIATNIKYIITV